MKGHAVLTSKASDEWSTPQAFFDVVNAEFDFTVDAAASDKNYKVPDYYVAAFAHPWGPNARIWLNPPYSRIGAFMEKAADESDDNLVVCLVPARTDTKWWHMACQRAHEVRLLMGRLSFGDSKASAPFPSALFVFRPDRDLAFYEPRIYNWDWRAK